MTFVSRGKPLDKLMLKIDRDTLAAASPAYRHPAPSPLHMRSKTSAARPWGSLTLASVHKGSCIKAATCELHLIAICWGVIALHSSAVRGQTVAVASPGNVPDFGNVTAAIVGDTDFRVSSGGTISVAAGAGKPEAVSTANTITLTCSGGGNNKNPCNQKNVYVRIIPTTMLVGRARAVKNITVEMDTAIQVSPPSPDGSGTKFTIGPIGRNSSKSFRVGMDLPIAGGFGTSGAASASYQVQAGFAPSYTASANGAARATTRNGVQLVKDSNLSFGTILPLGGQTGTVSVDPSSGDWSTSNPTGILLRGGTPTAAAYTITGEGGQLISVTVPSTFQMTRSSGGDLTVSTTKTVSGSITLSNSSGQSGNATFGVGGSFSIPGNIGGGTYRGSFTVIINWS